MVELIVLWSIDIFTLSCRKHKFFNDSLSVLLQYVSITNALTRVTSYTKRDCLKFITTSVHKFIPSTKFTLFPKLQ